MTAVRSEVEELREKIVQLEETISSLRSDNELLKVYAPIEVLSQLQMSAAQAQVAAAAQAQAQQAAAAAAAVVASGQQQQHHLAGLQQQLMANNGKSGDTKELRQPKLMFLGYCILYFTSAYSTHCFG